MMDDIRAERVHVLNISSHSGLWSADGRVSLSLSLSLGSTLSGSQGVSTHPPCFSVCNPPTASQEQLIISNSLTSAAMLKQDIPEHQSESCECRAYQAKLGMRLKRSHHKVDFTGSSCAYKIDIS